MSISLLRPLRRVNSFARSLVLVPLRRLLAVLAAKVKEVEGAEDDDDDREGDEDAGGAFVGGGLVGREEPGRSCRVGKEGEHGFSKRVRGGERRVNEGGKGRERDP